MAEAQEGETTKASRSLSTRAERSLKEVDRIVKANPDQSPHWRAMTQVEQAKAFALLDLADALRKADG